MLNLLDTVPRLLPTEFCIFSQYKDKLLQEKASAGKSKSQGWKKSIMIDIRLRYSLFFVYRMHWSLYFFESVSNMALSLLFFFSAQFDIPYSILFVQVTLSHFSKFKIIVVMSFTCFC